MADWNLPTLTSLYADFLTYIKDRDFDAISLGLNTITNPQTGMIRYVRASNKFQEYDGAAWQDKVLSLASGGLGAVTAAGGRTTLGLGTIATQNENTVALTGGTISGLGSLGVNGNATVGGILITGSGAVNLTNAAGKIPALTSPYFASLDASTLTGFTAAQIPSLDASKITTGVFNHARLGTGGGGATKFLREDGTYQETSMVKSVQKFNINYAANPAPDTFIDFAITALTNHLFAVIHIGQMRQTFSDGTTFPTSFAITSNTNIRMALSQVPTNNISIQASIQIVEFKNVG